MIYMELLHQEKNKILSCVQCLVSLIPADSEEERLALHCQFISLHPLALVNIPYHTKCANILGHVIASEVCCCLYVDVL